MDRAQSACYLLTLPGLVEPLTGLPGDLFRNTYTPLSPAVMMSGRPSWLRSATLDPEPTPERLWMTSGTNRTPPGALLSLTARYQTR